MNKWVGFVLGFSLAVNMTVLGTVVFLWKNPMSRPAAAPQYTPVNTVTENIDEDRIVLLRRWPGEPENVFLKRLEYKQELESVKQDIDGNRKQIVVLLLQEPPDTVTIHTVVEDLAEKQVEAEVLTVDHLLDIRPMLPREQWRQLVLALQAGGPPPKNIEHEIEVKQFEWVPEGGEGRMQKRIIIEERERRASEKN